MSGLLTRTRAQQMADVVTRQILEWARDIRLTPRTLAQLVDVSPQSVQNWMQGNTPHSFVALVNLNALYRLRRSLSQERQTQLRRTRSAKAKSDLIRAWIQEMERGES